MAPGQRSKRKSYVWNWHIVTCVTSYWPEQLASKAQTEGVGTDSTLSWWEKLFKVMSPRGMNTEEGKELGPVLPSIQGSEPTRESCSNTVFSGAHRKFCTSLKSDAIRRHPFWNPLPVLPVSPLSLSFEHFKDNPSENVAPRKEEFACHEVQDWNSGWTFLSPSVSHGPFAGVSVPSRCSMNKRCREKVSLGITRNSVS